MAGKAVIHNINYFGDRCACGWYRLGFPAMALHTLLNGEYRFQSTDTENVILDPRFYQMGVGTRVVRIQRWFGWDKLKIVKEFLKPLSEKLGFWLVYEIDDVLCYNQIPNYNVAKPTFSPELIGDSTQQIMNLCDFITVSTQELKRVYMHEYKIPEEKFLIIPNYLPRWWIGEAYDLNRQMHQWQEQRNRPTIAFVCSINHFDLQNRNGGVDDFTHLIPWIIQNMNRYKFVFVGGVPLQLHQYVKEGKITFQPPSDLFNYPREMQKRKIDLLVAPLANNNFNKCKSNIKFLEFSALGIPMAGQNICTYNKYTKLVFNDGNDLDQIISKMFFEFGSEEFYRNTIINQRAVIDGQPGVAGSGYWLQKNIQKYYNLYSIPQKTISVDF